MKKKIISTTYLREAQKYQMKLFLDEENYYVSVKKLIEVSEPFIIYHNIVAMDNGYYIIEIIPKSGHVAMRIFLNKQKELVEYYFDIIKESGIDEESKIPYFMDLYIDFTMLPNQEIHILDEEELELAYQSNEIDKEDYLLAKEVAKCFQQELENQTTPLLKIDYKKYVGDF